MPETRPGAVNRPRPGVPCGLYSPQKTPAVSPAASHLFRANLIFTKWLQALTSYQVLGLSPGSEETRSHPTVLSWLCKEGHSFLGKPSPALLGPQ